MSLGKEQEIFAGHFAGLITYAISVGLPPRIGEVWRHIEMQKLYVQRGSSKTMKSSHLDKLAGDLLVIINGRIANADEMRPLGKYWEALDPKNRWGGSWRGLVESGASSFIDAPHFERKL